jgi:hypothetical protein
LVKAPGRVNTIATVSPARWLAIEDCRSHGFGDVSTGPD